MREIKFRAWEVQTKRMLDWNYFMNISTDYLFGRNGNSIMIPMQFTGLLDKNGKEIYEGDIISTGGVHVGAVIGIIIYESPRYMYQAVGGKVDGIMFEIVGHKKFEIIGNMYENKELLDK